MEICYNLSQKEIEEVQFTIRFITNRQNRPRYLKLGIGHFEQSYTGWHRRDMFWIGCHLDNINLGSLVVEPNLQDPVKIDLGRNYNKVSEGFPELILRAHAWFMSTPEYQQQVIWTKLLIEKIRKDERVDFQDTLVSSK